MNKKKHLLFIILTVILCISVMFTAIACDDKKDTPEEEEKATQLFTNGDFSVTSGETYPLTPGSWTGALGYTSAPSGSDNLIAGVIDTEDKAFSKNRRTYGRVANPGKSFDTADGDSSNLLMIYNKANTFYKYTSSSISLTANHYYKLSFAIKTVNLSSNNSENRLAGANVFVNGSAYAEYTGINTNGEWQYKELYIQNGSSSGSFTVVAQLGGGSSSDTAALTSGHAFFDNFVLTDLTDVEEDETAFTQDDFDNVTIGTDGATTTQKYSTLLGDTDMNYTTGNASPYTASKYSTITGFGNGDNAWSSSSYVEKGILDTSITSTLTTSYGDKTRLDLTTPSNSLNSKVLYIQNKRATAYGYRNQTSYTLNSGENTYYKISVMVRTHIPDANKGATLKLTTGSGADNDLGIKINNINNSEWTEYSFVIKANQIRNRSVYLEMWLGEGGQEDTDTHVIGSAFFDCISFSTATEEEYNSTEENSQVATKADLTTDMANINSIDGNIFNNDIHSDNLPINSTTSGVVSTEDTAWSNSQFSSVENPKSALSNNPEVIVINNFLPTSYRLSNIFRNSSGAVDKNGSLGTILPNSNYIISFWVKTKDIKSGSGLTASLNRFENKNNLSLDNVAAGNYASFFTSSSEFTAINTEDLKDYVSEGNNGYTEFAFYVQGNELVNSELALSFALGSGDKTSSASHISGYAFISNITIEKIEPTEYTSATASTVLKKLSLQSAAGSNEVSSNGFFNYINTTDTLSQYSSETLGEGKEVFNGDGKLSDVYGIPTGWTISNSALLDNDGESLTDASSGKALAGVVDLTSEKHKAAMNTLTGSETANIEQLKDKGLVGYNVEDYPHILMLKTNNVSKFNYTSSNLSLSANSYYMVTVWARTISNDDRFSIVLSSTTNTSVNDTYEFSGIEGHTDWKQYSFFIQTGYSSVTAKLSLYAGNNNTDAAVSSTVFFANASYASISEDAYNAGVEGGTEAEYKLIKESWLTDTFDQTSGDASLATPSGWTGATLDKDASSDEDHLAAGVFNKNSSDWGDLDLDADNDSAIVDAIFNDTDTTIGNKTLVIYNKQNTAYGYTSNSISLKEDTYYKISIWLLTYGLKSTDSATVTLKINNLSYVFGKLSTSELTANEQARRINTSDYSDGSEKIGVWTQYNFYVKTEAKVTASATLSISLGADSGDDEALWMSGYVFADNFLTETISEEEFIARQPVEGETEDTIDESIIDSALVPNNFRIVFTTEDADAKAPEDDSTENGGNDNSFLWLYITSGVIGGLIVIVVIAWLIKKFAPKRKFGAKSKASYDKNSDVKNNDRKNKYNS